MEKIITAEQFLKENNVVGMTDLLTPMMIEFAKLHVEAALKVASEKISDKKGKYIMPNKEFILISYPLNNIK